MVASESSRDQPIGPKPKQEMSLATESVIFAQFVSISIANITPAARQTQFFQEIFGSGAMFMGDPAADFDFLYPPTNPPQRNQKLPQSMQE
ncbi:MAG: hypothetical protein GKR97_05355 [Rhizobiaceae bacterium]|nr:hypothetical protein [Rhizobiaceae bacterium]